MKGTRSFSRRPKAWFIIAAGLLLFCGLAYLTELKMHKVQTLPEIRMQQTIPEYPEPILKTRLAAVSVRDHLLDGDFKIVDRVKSIPEPWRAIFDASFVEIDGSPAKRDRVQSADPGQPIQESDSVVPGLSFRRLIFAGLGVQRTFIYYEHGGGVPHSYCLAVVDVGSGSVVWVGEARKEARNLRELRLMVSGDLFDESPGPGC
jgi:hypothetical protein